MTDEAKGADTNATASSETPAKPSLSSLLEDWDKDAAPASDSKPAEAKPAQNDARVSALEYKLEMKEIIPKVRGDLQVDDRFVETYIQMRANDDARLGQLWENRDANRAAWDQAIDSMAPEFKAFVEKSGLAKAEAPKPASKPADDKGLAAAAHMARETKPAGTGFEAVDWESLGDSEFAMKKAQYFRTLTAN